MRQAFEPAFRHDGYYFRMKRRRFALLSTPPPAPSRSFLHFFRRRFRYRFCRCHIFIDAMLSMLSRYVSIIFTFPLADGFFTPLTP
jgi:hypothetical protein